MASKSCTSDFSFSKDSFEQADIAIISIFESTKEISRYPYYQSLTTIYLNHLIDVVLLIQ